MELINDNYCFACGKDNPIGLKLEFKHNCSDKSRLVTTAFFTAKREHQGFKGVVHGGIISTLLDEAMAYLCVGKGYYAVTAKMEIRFKKPAAVGDKLKIFAEIVDEKSKLITGKARIENSSGEVVAEGTSTFIKVSQIHAKT